MMKIDVSKIDGYDKMTAEEKLKAIEELEIETDHNSDEVLKLKEALNKASSDVANYKKQLKEKMTEQERIEAERKEEIEKKDKLLESLLKEKEISDFTNNFLSVGYSEEMAKSSAEAIVNKDFGAVFGNLKTFIEGIEKNAKVEALKSTPKPTGNQNDNPSVTKEQFNNMEYTERVKFAEENPDLFNQYSEES